MGGVFGQNGSIVADIADWLSVVGFLLALWATWGVRRLRKAYQDIIRGQDLLEELRRAASEISDAASDVEANRDALLLAVVSAEATMHEGMAEERRRREEAERERDDLRERLYARSRQQGAHEAAEGQQGRGEPRSDATGSQEGTRRPWWRRMFGS